MDWTQILEEIDEAIADPYSLKKSIVRDLHQLKIEFRQKMAEMMDEFSFKILSNIERDMVYLLIQLKSTQTTDWPFILSNFLPGSMGCSLRRICTNAKSSKHICGRSEIFLSLNCNSIEILDLLKF